MTDQTTNLSNDKPTFRFLSFANDREDAEKEAKLKDAAARIEQAIAREKALGELIDCPTPSQEETAIDPANDHRSLFERLQEQKNKKKNDLEESQKMSNLITTLDDDDVSYLNEVAKNQREEELRRRLEVHDVLEAKKRLEEQKMLEKERQLQNSLLIGTSRKSESKGAFSKSRISAMVKIKPKAKNTSNQEKDTSEHDNVQQPQTPLSGGSSTSNSTSKRAHSPKGSTLHHNNKKQSIEKSSNKLLDNKDDKRNEEKHSDSLPAECSCPKGVARVLGVLPSMPIVTKNNCPDSDDTDYSDNETEARLIPRLGVRKK